MAIDRRLLLAAAVGLAASAPATAFVRSVRAHGTEARYLSARRRSDGTFSVARLTAAGRLDLEVALPSRAHAVVARPRSSEFVALARRPDRFGLAKLDGRPPSLFHAASDRHFYGHGAYAADGRLFYTSENDFGAGRGVLGIRDARAGYRQLGELPAHGIGPHEIAMLPGRTILAVANGGIATHPDYGRSKLNLTDMAPSLVYVDARTGDLLEQARLPAAFHQLSIRHLAIGIGTTLAFALQYEGPANDRVPLVGLHRPGQAPRLLTAPEPVWLRMKQYCGSVSFDSSGRVLAVSAPRGGLVAFWDIGTERFLGTHVFEDACGLAASGAPGEFLVTSGRGAITLCNPSANDHRLVASPRDNGEAWDNHLLRIST